MEDEFDAIVEGQGFEAEAEALSEATLKQVHKALLDGMLGVVAEVIRLAKHAENEPTRLRAAALVKEWAFPAKGKGDAKEWAKLMAAIHGDKDADAPVE